MKRFLLLTVAFLAILTVRGQDENVEDSLLIENLKQQLKSAKGTKEVDILNDIAFQYMWYGPDKTPSFNYASQAKKKAEEIKYEKGIGFATFFLAYQYVRSNKAKADSMFKAVLKIGEKLNDHQLLAWYYYQMWDLPKALTHFKAAGDIDGEGEVVTWLCGEYSGRSDETRDFSYCQRAIELADLKKKRRFGYNKWLSGFAYTSLAGKYNYVGDHKTALELIDKGKKYSDERDLHWSYASTYEQMGNIDSALFHYEKALEAAKNKWHVMRFTAYANHKVGNFKRAVELLETAIKMYLAAEKDKKGSPTNWRGEIYSHLAESYDSLGDKKSAIENYKYALEHSRKMYQLLITTPKPGSKFYGFEGERKILLMSVTKELSNEFSGLKKYDSALIYLRRHIQWKDSVEDKKKTFQLHMQLSNYKKAAEEEKRTGELLLLQKNNQLTQAKLKQETFMKNSLAVGLILLSLIGVFVFRTVHLKRKNEKLRRLQLENELKVKDLVSKQQQTELQQKATELEMQALRAQMNPHFIFNCLSSINRFVLKNETETASDYLTRFSRLIRMVLINSQKSVITLEDELEMLRLYLDMERLRFKHSFDYHIIYSNTVDAGNIFIPPLLLQPFCENAIWHGLMHLPAGRQGKLDINIRMEKNVLHCTISDNGIGRKKAAELKSKAEEKSKSLGLKITADRLALLNEHRDMETVYEMHDLVDENGNAAGTKVDLRIRYKEEVTELVP